MVGVWEGLNLGSIPNFFLCFGMHPKIIDVYPKLIPKGGVVQFTILLLLLFLLMSGQKKLTVVQDKLAMLSCNMLSLLSLHRLFTKTSLLLPSVVQCYLHSDTNKYANMKIFFPAIRYMPYNHH